MNKYDQFNWWLTCIPDRIEELRESLDPERAARLDGSLASLDMLEAYLLETYPPRTLSLPENSQVLDRYASYVGDVAEKYFEDAVWTINVDDKENVNYNFPVLKLRGSHFNPFTAITASIHRKKGHYIRECVEKFKTV